MPARPAPELTPIAFAAPVNVELLDEVVGPVTVLVADVDVVVIVPLLDEVKPPLGERVDVEGVELSVLVMLADEVVVEQEADEVVEAAPEEEDVVDAEPDVVETEVVELAAALEEEGVQPERVKVPL
jgi:hypothetical protein